MTRGIPTKAAEHQRRAEAMRASRTFGEATQKLGGISESGLRRWAGRWGAKFGIDPEAYFTAPASVREAMSASIRRRRKPDPMRANGRVRTAPPALPVGPTAEVPTTYEAFVDAFVGRLADLQTQVRALRGQAADKNALIQRLEEQLREIDRAHQAEVQRLRDDLAASEALLAEHQAQEPGDNGLRARLLEILKGVGE